MHRLILSEVNFTAAEHPATQDAYQRWQQLKSEAQQSAQSSASSLSAAGLFSIARTEAAVVIEGAGESKVPGSSSANAPANT